MFGKSKSKRREKNKSKFAWMNFLSDAQKRRQVVGVAFAVVMVVFLGATGYAVTKLEAHVHNRVHARTAAPTLTFVDMPDGVAELALDDLSASVADLLEGEWTDESLCATMAGRLTDTGWLASLNFVRRLPDARFEVSGVYRIPQAMVQHGDDFLLIDGQGIRLPGLYRYAPTWKLVQGVSLPPPAPGQLWNGQDVQTALDLVRLIESELYSGQITGVLVENVGGRVAPSRCHVELATDRSGGRIRWGSGLGMELEENSAGQKMAILRANYGQTGRADANHTVIDVSTFPDRFTIPG